MAELPIKAVVFKNEADLRHFYVPINSTVAEV